MRSLFAATLASLAILPSIGNARLGTVQTESGMVAGTGDSISAYLGIPYAAAPVGDLRWRPPAPVAHWNGVRDATQFGANCVQPAEYPELRGAMSEDCLNLNVWSPAASAQERLPVMVWIHGGGFRYGSGSHPSYDGQALAQRGVVVVTLNYRLGLLGYMAHPHLSAEASERTSGNYGLMDQLAALRWVQRNIARFGGDPAKVTVFGQSAGAHSISTMLVTPQANGLFQQAIMESVGVYRPMASLKQAEQFGLQVGPDIAALRKLPATDFVAIQDKLRTKGKPLTEPEMVSLIVDGKVLPAADYVLLAQGKFHEVPIIVGSNANEGGGAAKNIPVTTGEELARYLALNFPGMQAQAAQDYAVEGDDKVRQLVADLYGDIQFRFGTQELLQRYAALDLKAYPYVFAQTRNGSTQSPIHGDELQYVFGNLSASHRGKQKPYDKADEATADRMMTAWTNFAKTGDPNGGDVKGWTTVSASQPRPFEFGHVAMVPAQTQRNRLELIKDYYQKQRP